MTRRRHKTDNRPVSVDLATGTNTPSESVDLAIEVRNLRVCLGPGPGKEILSGFNLEIPRHTTTCIIGASASGKSVAVRSILGILPGAPGIVGGAIRINPPDGEPVDVLEGLADAVRVRRNGGMAIDSRWQRKVAGRLRPLWGNTLGYVAQLGAQALDPSRPVGCSLLEAIRRRDRTLSDDVAARKEALEWLERLNFRDPSPSEVMVLYPSQLSGGMAQRVVLAVALARGARFLFADEPTTGLDPESQDRLLELFDGAKKSGAIDTLVLVTHDFGVAERLADHVAVIANGRVVEQSPAGRVFGERGPVHETTRSLLEAFRDFGRLGGAVDMRPTRAAPASPASASAPCSAPETVGIDCGDTAPAGTGCSAAGRPRLRVQGLRKSYAGPRFDFSAANKRPAPDLAPPVENVSTKTRLEEVQRYWRALRSGLRPRRNLVLDGVDLELYPGEVVGLVGPSGEGKTTLAACLVRIVQAEAGRIYLDGEDILILEGRELRKRRRDIQLLFQDPTAALHSRMTVRQGLMETATQLLELNKGRARLEIETMLRSLHLEDCADSLPAQLSGGQLRRVGLCRALMLHPRVLIVDEPTASVDASLRADVLRLLRTLCTEKQQTAILLISHDRRVIYHMADRAFTIKNRTLRSISRQSLRGCPRGSVAGSRETNFDTTDDSFQRECS